jgi:hypothetical protein
MSLYTTECWSVYLAGTNAGASAEKDAASLKQHFVTGVYGYSDTAGNVDILDGDTVVARWTHSAAKEFFYCPVYIPISSGAKTTGRISASSAACNITLQGFSVPGGTAV